MSKKTFIAGFQTTSSGGLGKIRRDSKTGAFKSVKESVGSIKGKPYPPHRVVNAKPKHEVAVKPVPLDPDAFMDYLLEEDAIIMEYLAK